MVWKLEQLRENIKELKDVRQTSDIDKEEYRMYIVTPYLASLGYDVYNFKEVILHSKLSRLDVNISEDITMTISMDKVNMPEYFADEGKSLYLSIDISRSKYSLYAYALGVWERLFEIDIFDETEENQQSYLGMMKYIVKSSIISEYQNKGERVFTEGAVRKLLTEQDFNNRFIQTILKKELENPSDQLRALIVARIVESYSTEDSEELFHLLEPLKDLGIVGIVDSALNRKQTSNVEKVENRPQETTNESNLSKLDTIIDNPKPTKEDEPKEEVVENKEVEEDNQDNQDLPIPPKDDNIEDTKEKDEPKEESITSLEDLLDSGSDEDSEVENKEMSLDDLLSSEESKEEETEMNLDDLMGNIETTKETDTDTNIVLPQQENLPPNIVNDEDELDDYEDPYKQYENENRGISNLKTLVGVSVGEPVSVSDVESNLTHRDTPPPSIEPIPAPTKRNKVFKSSRTENKHLDKLKEQMNKGD